MRWDNLLSGQGEPHDEPQTLPGVGRAVVRTFKTPEFKGMTFYEVMARSIINHVSGDRFGFNWTINPYRGCSHACTYCFARPTHTYLEFDAGRQFETEIVVKVNAPQLLRRELAKPSWSGEHIAMGTNTDPYQRAEGHYKLMRGILSELNRVRNPYSILTKGTLIRRDIDLLAEGAAITEVGTNFSVGSVDERVWRETEPGTPHPMKRLEVLTELNAAGVPCGVLMAPILPGISDSPEQLEATVKACVQAGATHIIPITLHLRPGVKEEFMGWLLETHPDLVKTYEQMYPRSDAPKALRDAIGRSVTNMKTRHGHVPAEKSARPARAVATTAPAKKGGVGGEQLTLGLPVVKKERRAPNWIKQAIREPEGSGQRVE